MLSPSNLKSYLPLALGLVIVLVLTVLAPWKDILPLLRRVDPWAYAGFILLSLIYYVAKAVRFWYMLRVLDLRPPLRPTLISYFTAQPVSLIPAGELYRTVMLKRYTGTSIRAAAPTVTMQGLIEAVVLVIFALIGALFLDHDRLLVLLAAAGVALVVVALQRGWLIGRHNLVNKLPLVNISPERYDQYFHDHRQLLTGRPFIRLLLMSFVPVLCGIGILWLAASQVGARLNPAQAGIAYTLPVILSGLSFLPAGLGASEGGMLGILKLLNVSLAAAFAITLLSRVFTLGAGLVYGLMAMIFARLTVEKL